MVQRQSAVRRTHDFGLVVRSLGANGDTARIPPGLELGGKVNGWGNVWRELVVANERLELSLRATLDWHLETFILVGD